MNADLKAQWIAALRSGKYQQGYGELRGIDDHFCCLGVLCDVAGVPQMDGVYDFGGKVSRSSVHGEIGEAVPMQCALMEMNDADGKSFAEIADWIEEHVDAN